MGRSSGVNSLDERFLFGIIRPHNGEVPEWPIGAVSKTVVVFLTTVGSNPTLSADRKQPFMVNSNREGFFLVTCRWDTHPLRQTCRSLSASWAIPYCSESSPHPSLGAGPVLNEVKELGWGLN